MSKTIIIAEAGVNHNGDLSLARELIDAAASAGADYVKFQTFKASAIVSQNSIKAIYQKKNTDEHETQLEMLKKLELSEQDHIELIKYCHGRPIQFLSTAFDIESIRMLKRIGIRLGKIPSGEITNLPYLREMAASFQDIILSTGMCTHEEIEAAIEVLIGEGVQKKRITVLHCTTEYPTPFEEVNLLAMPFLQSALGVRVGYSDHTKGIEVPIAAVALGAKVIEKHFTLDRNLPGPDHKASLEPSELALMVSGIRNIELALGESEKKPTNSELKNKDVVRKSIVAAIHISMGEEFTSNNLTVKRPGTGISPMKWDLIIGKKAIRDFNPDDLIEI